MKSGLPRKATKESSGKIPELTNTRQSIINMTSMKKLFICFTISALTTSAYAQSSGSTFHFGVKAQPALAWLRVDAPSGTDLTSDGLPFGFGYGFIADFNFSDRYSFSTGLEIAYRGGKTKYAETDNSSGVPVTHVTKKNYTLQFIELPLTLKLRSNEIGYMTYFFQAGIAPGYAIRTRAEIKVDDVVTEKHADAGNDINEFNLSMIIAAGAEYNISGNTSLLFGLCFNNGFLDVLDDSPYHGARVKGNSNYLALTVGILF